MLLYTAELNLLNAVSRVFVCPLHLSDPTESLLLRPLHAALLCLHTSCRIFAHSSPEMNYFKSSSYVIYHARLFDV